uniref:Uncharacterized protein n=1 Tax=Arundo donax TaxID=35708 RepID=A0A0A9HM98_ARUDO
MSVRVNPGQKQLTLTRSPRACSRRASSRE